jgi:hypothetical protein
MRAESVVLICRLDHVSPAVAVTDESSVNGTKDSLQHHKRFITYEKTQHLNL